jgi:hypothetical protein
MYVRIMSVSKPWLWYRGMVGKTFRVEPSLFGYRVDEYGQSWNEVILKRDCVVLTSHNGRKDASMRKVM